MIKRLRIRFVVINMSVFVIMLSIILCTIIYFTKADLENNSVGLLQSIAEIPTQVIQSVRTQKELKLPIYAIEISKSGEIISSRGDNLGITDESSLRPIVKSMLSSPKDIGVLYDYNLRYHKISFPQVDRVIFIDITNEITTMQNLMRNCIYSSLISIVLFLGTSIWFSKLIVLPIELSLKQQKQFISDASHDLKTPLTVILTSAGMIKSNQCAPELIPKLNDNIITVSIQMRELVEGLISLAKSDEGIPKGERRKVDFGNIVTGCCLSIEPVYYDNDLTLLYDDIEHCYVLGNELLLRQTIEIILDNAIKYSIEKGTTTVSISSSRTHYILSISNEGYPITQEHLSKIFNRFYRVDQARTETNGHGLGLSIAQNIIKDHDGSVWAESSEGINTIFIKLRRMR